MCARPWIGAPGRPAPWRRPSTSPWTPIGRRRRRKDH
uniref:Uncharacterized protein n=1 Tax=Arundo donax TaxID=35708 RepID=A0A0A9DXY7_ARUDO